MKNTCWILIIFAVTTLFSCQEEEVAVPELTGEGNLQLNFALGKENLINARGNGVSGDYFDVSLLNEAQQEIQYWKSMADVPEMIRLKTGKYQVKVSSDLPTLPAFDAVYYTGSSELFEVGNNTTATVDVTAKLSNAKVSVNYAESVKTDFFDYFVRVADSDGAYLTYGKEEERAGYFYAGDLQVYVKLFYLNMAGDTAYFEKLQILKEVEANDFINITIQADLKYGDGLFHVETDEEVNQKDVVISFEDTTAIYSENLATLQNGVAFASSFDNDSIKYAQQKYDPMLDSVVKVYNIPSPEKAFDGRSSHWESSERSGGMPQYLGFDFGAGNGKTIRQYSMYGTQWGTPKSWTFEGSVDGENWEILDEKADAKVTPFETTDFTISNTNNYQYYRIVVTKATGLTDAYGEKDVNFVLIRELELREQVN